MPRGSQFPEGLALDAHKQAALTRPIVELPPSVFAVLALDQGSGSALVPVVTVDDNVAVGTVIGRPRDERAAALHSPVSGRVMAVEIRDAATVGGKSPCVIIENDGLDHRDPTLPDCIDVASLDPGALITLLAQAGIAGLGGAAFPIATKLRAGRTRKARRLLLNGAECEPWICCDDALLRTQATGLVEGADVLVRALGADATVIAIEDDKPEAIAAVRASLSQARTPIELRIVPAVYPQGAERQLITALYGVEVPALGLPADVEVTCQNVATAIAVSHWMRTGMPLVARTVTVTGSGVAAPCNVQARLGTPLADLVEAAGGYRGTPVRLIAGGSMTGRAIASDEIGVSKAMNCVLVATAVDLQPRLGAVEVPCIRCGDCATVCPAGLLPQQLHRAAMAGDEDGLVVHGLFDCIDCGCCDYVCPSQIPLAHRFRVARTRLGELAQSRRRADDWRARHDRHERRVRESADIERQAFEEARRHARGDDAPASPPPDHAND
jgi:electron transport complex protein RnfC